MARGMARRAFELCWGCWVAIHEGLVVSSRFGWCELGGSLTPKAALITKLLRSQVSKRPKKVTGTGPVRGKADGTTLIRLLGGYSWFLRIRSVLWV